MTVVLHIGTHKTGTTSIQQFAASNRSELRQRGLWYPSYLEIGRPDRFAHHDLAHAIAGDPAAALTHDGARLFVEQVEARRQQDETVLVSAEPFYRHRLPVEGGYWEERRAYIARMRSFFPAPDVRVLAVVRRQDAFARSLYQERVKVTDYPLTFRVFIERERTRFEYFDQLELFRQAFGTVDVLVYEDLAAQGLVDAFFRHLGLDVSDIPGRTVANPSIPIELVEFKRILNGAGLSPERLGSIGTLLVENAPRFSGQPKLDWLPASEMAGFCRSFEEQNERLRAAYLPARPAPLFPPCAEPAAAVAPQVYGGMSAERFAAIAAELLL